MEAGVAVSVQVGTATFSTTSANGTAAWSVDVSADASYITGTSVDVRVTAAKTGFTAPSAVERTLTVDLVAPTAPTYTAPGSLTVGAAITSMSPTGASGVSEYDAPGLPAGLSINAGTGVISGTPTAAATGAASVTVTGSDSAGNTDTVSITFPAVAKGDQTLSGFSYSPSSVAFGLAAPTLTAPGGAQGTLSYAATPATVCTVEAATGALTLTGVGSCTVTVTAAATANYNEASASYTVTVRENTAPPGPLVEEVDMPAAPSGAAELAGPFRTRKAFYDREGVPDDAVHGADGRLTFTLTFDEPVTVEDGSPELVLDVWKRARRAQLITPTEQLSDTNTLTFAWTVAKGDNDPDGIRIASLDLNGARIRFEAGCDRDPITNIEQPCDIDLPTFAARYGKTYSEHRVRGGLHSIALSVSGGAREGQPFAFAATRDGGFGEEMYAIVQIEDSAFPDQVVHRKVEFAAGRASDDGVAHTTATFTPQGDDAADPDGERRLTLFVGTTEVGIFAPACVFAGASETCTQWYDTPEGGRRGPGDVRRDRRGHGPCGGHALARGAGRLWRRGPGADAGASGQWYGCAAQL